MINKEQVQGKANQFVGTLKKEWGKLTDDELSIAEGEAQKFKGIVQERYGLTAEQVEKKYNELKSSCGCDGSSKAA